MREKTDKIAAGRSVVNHGNKSDKFRRRSCQLLLELSSKENRRARKIMFGLVLSLTIFNSFSTWSPHGQKLQFFRQWANICLLKHKHNRHSHGHFILRGKYT